MFTFMIPLIKFQFIVIVKHSLSTNMRFLNNIFTLISISALVESRRMKGSKSPKSGKVSKDHHPKEVCIEKGFLIQPEFDGEINALSFCQKCCDPACSATDANGIEILTQCGADLVNGLTTGDFGIVDTDCLESVTQTFPFGHILDGQTAAFEFTNSEAFIGNGSFRGKINANPVGGGEEKVILRYLSGEFDGFNREMKNMEVSKLEYIEYSFKATSCGSSSPCPNQFYMNVLTRTSAASTNYYDCNFPFVPTTGGDPSNPGWTTVRFDLTSPSTTRATPGSNPPECLLNGSSINNLGDVASEGWVLGTDGNDPGLIFALNMGDAGTSDVGLEGFFDRVVVKLTHEESPRVYDLEPGFAGFF